MAQAGETITYCGKLIQHGSYCRGSNGAGTVTATTHSYNYNAAMYFGGGQQYMCERALPAGDNPYSSGSSYSYRCAYLNGSGQFAVDSRTDLSTNCIPIGLIYMDVYVLNLSGAQHTVYGSAKYGTGQGYPC